MKLLRIGSMGAEVPVVEIDGAYFDVRTVTSGFTPEFWLDGVERIREALSRGDLPRVDPEGHRRGSPVEKPGSVVCIGMNYSAHAAESGAAPPTTPIMFLKPPNTLSGPDDDVHLPRGSAKTDWEVELAVVIGKRASYLSSPDEAEPYIGGYVLANDLSERAFQLEQSGGQWSKGKAAAGFTPIGPWIVTADSLSPGGLGMYSWVNGEIRQSSTTGDMIFSVSYLVWHLSQYMVLDPGDLVLTGTPQGVALSGNFPYLRPDDVCEVSIEGLGRQRQRFIAQP